MLVLAGPAILPAQSAAPEALLERYKADPANALLCEQIGVAYTRSNDLGKAAEFFRKAVALDPRRTAARKNLATVLWFLGQKEESIRLFEALAVNTPGDPVPQLYLALNAYERKDFEKAAQHFERAGTTATSNPETLPIVIETYAASGRAALAQRILETRISSGDRTAQTYRWLGTAYDRLAQPDKAFQAYSEAIRLDPASDENYLALASFSIDHANPAYARTILKEGLQKSPKSPQLLLELGLAWAIQGDFENGRQFFASAHAAQSEWALPLLALGITDLQTGNAARAAGYFETAKTLAPRDFRCHYLHALALKRSRGENDVLARKAEAADLRRAIELDPRMAKARVALADAEIADGFTSEAEANLRTAIRVEPTEPSSFYKLALLCRRQGKKEEAARLLQTFEDLKNKTHSEENEFVLMLKTAN